MQYSYIDIDIYSSKWLADFRTLTSERGVQLQKVLQNRMKQTKHFFYLMVAKICLKKRKLLSLVDKIYQNH